MSKKVLSVVLALVLIMSTFVTVAFAVSYENTEDASKNTQVWSLSEPTKVNDTTYTVDVNLKTNYATGVIEFVIVEDDANNAIALTDVTLGAGVPATYKAELSKNLSKGHVYIVPQTDEGTEIVTATAIDGVVATLTYSYTGTGSGTIAISNDPKTAENKGGTLIAARMGSNNIVDEDMIVGQTVVDANGVEINDETITPVTIGAAAVELDLAIEAAYADSGIIIDKNKTLGGAYDGVVYGFTLPATKLTATNYTTWFTDTHGNEINVVATPYARKAYGTGTTIQVLDGDTVVKTYVVVIFGDLTGDGQFNTGDVTRCVDEQEHNGTYALPQIMAANLVVAGRTDALKATNLYKVLTNDVTTLVGMIDDGTNLQVELAQGHYTYSASNYA